MRTLDARILGLVVSSLLATLLHASPSGAPSENSVTDPPRASGGSGASGASGPASSPDAKPGPSAPTASAAVAAAPPAAAPSRESQLAALATYGKAGVVRFVTFRTELTGKEDDRVVVRIQNEGDEPFDVRAGDTCSAVLADGTKAPLKRRPDPGEKKVPADIIVPPLHVEEIVLVPAAPARGAIASLDIAAQEVGRTITVKDPYTPPAPRLTVPPAAPPGPATGTVSPEGPAVRDLLGWEEVTAALVVGAEGGVSSVTILPDETGKRPRAELADAVVAAARTWTFEPARRNAAAERSVVVRTFRFGARKLVRRVFSAAAKDLEPRLARYLHESYPWVVDVTQARGYAVADRPWKKKGIRGADAWLVRTGEASPTETWVAVTSMTLLVRESSRGSSCECYWRAAQESGARDFMDLLAARLDLTAVQARELAPQQGSLIPSGALEGDELGRWSRTAVGKLFDASFSTVLGKNKRKVAYSGVLSRLEPNTPPPAAGEFYAAAGARGPGAAPDPIRVEGDVVPPVLSRRVNPEYSEEAKTARVQGRVLLEVVVDTAGSVTDLEIQRGVPGLNVSSVDAVCCWKFKPATKNGKPVSVFYPLYLDYGLR